MAIMSARVALCLVCTLLIAGCQASMGPINSERLYAPTSLCTVVPNIINFDQKRVTLHGITIPQITSLVDPECENETLILLGGYEGQIGREEYFGLLQTIIYSYDKAIEVDVRGMVHWTEEDPTRRGFVVEEYANPRIIDRPLIGWLDNEEIAAESQYETADLCAIGPEIADYDQDRLSLTGIVIPEVSFLIDPECEAEAINLFNRQAGQVGREEFNRLLINILSSQDQAIAVEVRGRIEWPEGGVQRRGFVVEEYVDPRVVERPYVGWLDS